MRRITSIDRLWDGDEEVDLEIKGGRGRLIAVFCF
jgi:hypothetical protein